MFCVPLGTQCFSTNILSLTGQRNKEHLVFYQYIVPTGLDTENVQFMGGYWLKTPLFYPVNPVYKREV